MKKLITLLLLVFLLSYPAYALQKNVSSQKWVVFAFDDTDNSAKTGDAAQITANVRIDGAAADAVDDTNPTELEDGYYIFDLAQGETNGDYIVICPASSTGDIQVIGCPMATWTTPPYFPSFSIDSNGRIDIIKVAGTTQTANDMSGDVDTIVTAVGNIETDTAAYDTDAEYAEAIWGAAVATYNDELDFGGELGGLDPNITFVLADTAAWDTANEARTLLTGGTTALCILTAANVEAEAVDALESFQLDHLLAITTGVAADSDLETYVVSGSVMAHLMSVGADVTTFKPSTDSPEAIRNRGDAAWIAAAAGLEVDMTKIHGTGITETSSGNLAGNFSTFWDNADAATSKVVDNVGASAAGGGSPLAITGGNLGDYKRNQTVYFIWRTVDQGGAAVNPTTAGTVKVYKNNADTEITAPTGITDTRGFDSLTGIHLCVIDLSANSFYATQQDYSVVLTGSTIDSQTVTSVIATFSIEKRWTEAFYQSP